MPNIFDPQIASAIRMIEKYGQEIEWRQTSEGVPVDPSKPWLGNETVHSTHNPSIVFLPTSRENMALIRALSETTIRTGSLIGLMGAVDFKPDDTDTVKRGDEVLTISYIDTLAPNGEPILYTIGFDV